MRRIRMFIYSESLEKATSMLNEQICFQLNFKRKRSWRARTLPRVPSLNISLVRQCGISLLLDLQIYESMHPDISTHPGFQSHSIATPQSPFPLADTRAVLLEWQASSMMNPPEKWYQKWLSIREENPLLFLSIRNQRNIGRVIDIECLGIRELIAW